MESKTNTDKLYGYPVSKDGATINVDISNWDVSGVTDFVSMFSQYKPESFENRLRNMIKSLKES